MSVRSSRSRGFQPRLGLDFNSFEVLSFDCYGTLIDWETGILSALRPVLTSHNQTLDDERILKLYAKIESQLESGDYVSYREILRKVVKELGQRLGFAPALEELNCLVDSLGNWQPFPDTVAALQTLKKKYCLAIISNTDDDLFARTARHLKVAFDWIVTSGQVKSYKPSLCNFTFALERMGTAPEKVLHVAQSIYHDIIPAKSLGLVTVWVNRRKGQEGFGATPPAEGKPDLEVPDLKTLVSLMKSNKTL